MYIVVGFATDKDLPMTLLALVAGTSLVAGGEDGWCLGWRVGEGRGDTGRVWGKEGGSCEPGEWVSCDV